MTENPMRLSDETLAYMREVIEAGYQSVEVSGIPLNWGTALLAERDALLARCQQLEAERDRYRAAMEDAVSHVENSVDYFRSRLDDAAVLVGGDDE